MEQKKVFINSIQDDTDFAREVKKSLEDAEIEVILSAPQVTFEGITSLVKKIEEVIEQSGVMLVILSEQAARDPLLISNTQLWFELAGKRQALLFCRKEEVKNDQSIALYYARAVQVGAQKNEDITIAKTVEAARRMLGLEKSQGVIHKRLLKKSAAWLAGGLAVLTLAAGILSYYAKQYQQTQEAIKAAQAPVIFNTPFAQESIDQGVTVISREHPVYQSTEDPEAQAPFHFEPDIVAKRIEFDDPRFEKTLDFSIIGLENNTISNSDQLYFEQNHGVLQFSGNSNSRDPLSITVPIYHVNDPLNTSYIGIRFRLEDYQGWNDIEQENNAGFGSNLFSISDLNLSKQLILEPMNWENQRFLGDDWHTLEAILSYSEDATQVYLDGEPFFSKQGVFNGYQVYTLMINFEVLSSTEFVNFYIDEIIYGSNEKSAPAESPEEAEFHYKPEESLLRKPMEEEQEIRIQNPDRVDIREGVLTMAVPPDQPDNATILFFPIQRAEENYFALKYKFSDASTPSWMNNGFLEINLQVDDADSSQNQYIPSVSTNLFQAGYFHTTGINMIDGFNGSIENYTQGGWHTMEMLITPASSDLQDYKLQFWHDGQMIGERELTIFETYLEEKRNLLVGIHFFGGVGMSEPVSVDVADLTIGSIPVNEVTH